MESKYKQLTLEERCSISHLHEDGKTIRQIATTLGRSPSTISRELRRNRGNKVGYKPAYADELSWARRWSGSKLERNDELRELVLQKLKMGWSPEQVAGRLALEAGKNVISYETIYRFIYAQIRKSDDFSWRLYLPRAKFKRGYRGRKGSSSVDNIKDRVGIEQRPESANTRSEIGHWEADLMLFSDKKSNLMVMQERKSRFTLLTLQHNKTANNIVNNQLKLLKTMPKNMIKTITNDNGTEFAEHYKLTQQLQIKTFFCKPHSPWQKGGVENMNGRIRKFLPRKSNLQNLSELDILALQNHLNNTPRKCLDFNTPYEIISKALHFNCESTFWRSPE